MTAIPLKFRQLQAAMKLKHLSLMEVATRAEIPYATASQVLNGRLNDPLRLQKLSTVIEQAPMPEAVA